MYVSLTSFIVDYDSVWISAPHFDGPGFVWKCCVVFIPSFSLSFSPAHVVRKHGFCAYPEQRNSTQAFSLGRPA